MNTAIGYIRVSTDQQEDSLTVQREQIQEYCQFKGFELTDIITDENVSGKTGLFTRESGQILRDSQQQNIVIVSISRAFRNTADALISMDHFTVTGRVMHVIDLGQAINTSTAIGRFLFTTMVSQAELERGLTAERIKNSARSKKKRMVKYCQHAPMGYKWDGDNMIEDEIGRSIIEQVVQLRSQGMSYSEIAAKIPNRSGTGMIGKSLVCRVLKLYVGQQQIQQAYQQTIPA